MIVPVVEQIKRSGVLVPLVEGDTQPKNVLSVLEVVRDAASIVVIRAVKNVSLAGPARRWQSTAVASIRRKAAGRAAAITGRPLVVPCGAHVDPGPLAGIDK